MAPRAEDVADARSLDFGRRLAVEQLAEAENGIKRRPQFVAHPGKKITLGVVRSVGFFFRFAQSLFHSRPFGYVVRHAKDDPLLSRPGDGPEHIHKAPILANVTIHKIGDFAARQQAFRGRFRYGPIFFEYEIDVTATHQLLSRVAPESFASGVHTQEAALLVDRADHILRFVHDELV